MTHDLLMMKKYFIHLIRNFGHGTWSYETGFKNLGGVNTEIM